MPNEDNNSSTAQNQQGLPIVNDSENLLSNSQISDTDTQLSSTQKLAKSLYDEYRIANTTLAEAVRTDNKTAIEQAKQNLSLIYERIRVEFDKANDIYNTAFHKSPSNQEETEATEKDLLYLADIVFEIEEINKKPKQQTRNNFNFFDFYKTNKTASGATSEDNADTDTNTNNFFNSNRYTNNQDNKHDLREQIRVREKEIRNLKKKLEAAQTEASNNFSELLKLQESQKAQDLQNKQALQEQNLQLQNLQNSYNQTQANIAAEKSEKAKYILELANAQKIISDTAANIASSTNAANTSVHIKNNIINLALAHLGHTAPENPKSDAFYNTILSLYDFVKKSLLTRHCWKFALAKCKLNLLTKQKDDYFSYALPNDLLNIQKIIPNCDYEILGNTLLCGTENINLAYIKNIDDLNLPEFFRTLMVYSITAASAALVTQNESIARKWELEANNSFCTAIATDSSQQATRSVIRNSIYMAHF